MDRTKVEMLRLALVDVVQELRAALEEEDIGNFYFKAVAEGRTTSGEAKLSFLLGKYSYDNLVTCGCPAVALDEFLRRESFALRHQAIALPSPGCPVEDEEMEIPF